MLDLCPRNLPDPISLALTIRQKIEIQTKYIRKDFNAAHQVCFANLRTLRGKPRGVLTRVISPKTKDTLCGVLDLVEIRGFEPLTYALRTHRSTN